MATGLATRCSACGTVFRVVPDQLRVSEGWVRCGRCSQVFNALEALVDLETGLPRRTGGGLVAGLQEESAEASFDVAQPAAGPGKPPLPAPPPPDIALDLSGPTDLARDPAPDASAPEEPASTSDTDVLLQAAQPSFVRNAERAARWQRPQVRVALVLAGLLLALTLSAQLSYEYRHLLAARLPEARPWLDRACEAMGCKVEAVRQIEHLAVESSGLVRVERSSLYRLQVSVRNKGALELSVPALDVTLTDNQGRLVARKVMRAADLGAPQATIGPGRELSLQATLQAASGGDPSSPPIAGYTIDLFYP